MAAPGTKSEVTTSTPYLDRLLPLPGPVRSRLQFLIGFLVGAAIAIAPLYFRRFWSSLPDLFELALDPWIFIFCCYIGVVVHESGHFLAGRMAGLHLNLVRFGPLQINAPFRISWHWKQGAGARGFTSMLPRTGNVSRQQVLIMLIGGPAANLFTAAIVFPFHKGSGELFRLPIIFVVASLLLGLGNLIPFQKQSSVSDGKRIWMLVSSKGRGERWIALFQIVTAISQSVEIDMLPDILIARATAFTDQSPDTVTAHAFAYSWAFYRKDTAEAAKFLETALAFSRHSSPAMREGLIAEAAVFQARRRKNIALAQQWFADLPAKPQLPTLPLNVEAAVFEAQDDFISALRTLEQSEKVALALPNRIQRDVSLRSVRRWKTELVEMLQQHKPAPTA